MERSGLVVNWRPQRNSDEPPIFFERGVAPHGTPATLGLLEALPDLAAQLSVVSQTGGWLGLAFALGLIHAFDADHVVAVSVLASSEGDGRGGVRTGLRWALGHGAVLLAVGVALLLLGLALPAEWVAAVERGVGFMMIGLGASVWIDLARRGSHLHFHVHDGLTPHAHWHTHDSSAPHPPSHRHRHEHVASMVGALHGLAGSAPILALLPTAARSPASGLLYLVLFGVGVAAAMALASGLLAKLTGSLERGASGAVLFGLRALSASGSIAIGIALATMV